MKFVKVAKTKKMLQIDIDGKTEWTNTSEAVYDYAKNNFKEGDVIELEYNEQNGMKFVTRITKAGQSQSNSSSQNSDKPTCDDCGATLKDSKYKKCYACNKKNPPQKKESKSSYYSKSPEDKEQIKRLSVLSSATRAGLIVQGQVDVNALADYILNLYDAFYKKVSE